MSINSYTAAAANDALRASDRASAAASALRQSLDYAFDETLCDVGHGALGLDQCAVIRFCNIRLLQLVGAAREDILGQPVTSLLIDLPLRAQTPGYNIALAIIWSCGSWQPSRLRRADGTVVPIRAALNYRRIAGRHLLALEVRGPQ